MPEKQEFEAIQAKHQDYQKYRNNGELIPSMLAARQVVEMMVKAYAKSCQISYAESASLADLISLIFTQGIISKETKNNLHTIRMITNKGVHNEEVSLQETAQVGQLLGIELMRFLRFMDNGAEQPEKVGQPNIRNQSNEKRGKYDDLLEELESACVKAERWERALTPLISVVVFAVALILIGGYFLISWLGSSGEPQENGAAIQEDVGQSYFEDILERDEQQQEFQVRTEETETPTQDNTIVQEYPVQSELPSEEPTPEEPAPEEPTPVESALEGPSQEEPTQEQAASTTLEPADDVPAWVFNAYQAWDSLPTDQHRALQTYTIKVGETHIPQGAEVWPLSDTYASTSAVSVDEAGIVTGVEPGQSFVAIRATTGLAACYLYIVVA